MNKIRPTLNTWLLRFTIILFMIFCVQILIHFTAIQDQPFLTCDRPCRSSEWPMICRMKLTVEVHSVLSSECNQCDSNSTICDTPGCILADGSQRSLLTVNRQLPVLINVCKGDIMVIDVENLLPGASLSLHWHGQRQEETPFMDGVPMITQCPIQSFTTFQYKFRASDHGTHFYQAFSGDKSNNGVVGSFVVRLPINEDPQSKLYDFDLNDHILMISEWGKRVSMQSHFDVDTKLKTVDSILINGLSSAFYSNLIKIFKVNYGKRYRFRLIYTGGDQGCSIIFSINKHKLKIISFDGKDIIPIDVSEIKLSHGERVDFILNANQLITSYSINVSSSLNCQYPVNGSAILSYETDTINFGDNYENTILEKSDNKKVVMKDFHEIKSIKKFNSILKTVDRTIYIPIIRKTIQRTHKYIKENRADLVFGIGNLTFTFPTSPLLTQPHITPSSSQCNLDFIPEKCKNKEFCDCVHVEKISTGDRVELIFINFDDESSIEYHLHGHYFHLVGNCEFPDVTSLTLTDIKQLNEKNLLCKRNFNDPVIKDTISINPKSITIVRFISNNVGKWMLRDLKSKGWTRGLDVVLHVGKDNEGISAPSNFPQCGNWIGPDFFLI